MHVDLTRAAQADHITCVPTITYDLPAKYGPAGYVDDSNTMRLGKSWRKLYHPDAYDQARFAKQGVGPLDDADATRFIIAHELWHARQYELDPMRALIEGAEIDNGQLDHDQAPTEIEADRHAAKTYKLIDLEN